MQRHARAPQHGSELARPERRLEPLVTFQGGADLLARVVVANVQRERGGVERVRETGVGVRGVREHLGDQPPHLATRLPCKEVRIVSTERAARVECVANRGEPRAWDRAHILVADRRQHVVDHVAPVRVRVLQLVNAASGDPALEGVVANRNPLARHHRQRVRGGDLRRDVLRQRYTLALGPHLS
ncbi:MAG: hypothetical protein ACREJ3_01185 [Polyangiaceae bacterium]